MHRARIVQTDRTSAVQCTERVYYKQMERVRYNTQSAYSIDRQNECGTMHRARILQTALQRRTVQSRTRAIIL